MRGSMNGLAAGILLVVCQEVIDWIVGHGQISVKNDNGPLNSLNNHLQRRKFIFVESGFQRSNSRGKIKRHTH